jgi:uroporphyrinogen-III synthase
MSVLLLKEPRNENGDDPYSIALKGIGHTAVFVPALEHIFVEPDRLRNLVASGPTGRFSGVVFTSQRAVEAWSSAAVGIEQSPLPRNDSASPSPSLWASVPFFAVGPATAAALSSPDLPPVCAPSPNNILGAESSGTGAALADLISATLNSHSSGNDTPPPLLFVKGDKGGEAIKQLSESGIRVVPIEAYATAARAALGDELSALFNSEDGQGLRWVVFFSPSGARAAMPILLRHRGLCFAAIGPTTRDHLERVEGVRVHAVASAPQPTDLVRVMREAANAETT